ncbi:MAG: cytochrome c biogenesis protein CcdA, partial [Actinomycetota bacterium]|nr:cytochrome c biogenesis protein CcdA [Actinomycetota bacterium]
GGGGGGFGQAYLLGAFSGIASACCAPVLAGVALLSGAAASFPAALTIGLAYVAGMVAPLGLAGYWWEHRRARATRLLSARTVTARLGRWSRRMPLGTLLSGLLMIGMGVLAVVIAFTGPAMSGDGWQTRAAATLQHLATRAAEALSWLPGWAVVVVLLVGLIALVHRARHTPPPNAGSPDQPVAADTTTTAKCCGATPAPGAAAPEVAGQDGVVRIGEPRSGVGVADVKETTR